MYFCNVKNVASIAIFLILVLLTGITVTSFSNFIKNSSEATQEESSQRQSKSTNQNVLEEEEQHGTESYISLPIEINVENEFFSFQVSKMSLVHIEVITPPPLF